MVFRRRSLSRGFHASCSADGMRSPSERIRQSSGSSLVTIDEVMRDLLWRHWRLCRSGGPPTVDARPVNEAKAIKQAHKIVPSKSGEAMVSRVQLRCDSDSLNCCRVK